VAPELREAPARRARASARQRAVREPAGAQETEEDVTTYADAEDVTQAIEEMGGPPVPEAPLLERILDLAAGDVDRACRGAGDVGVSPLFDLTDLTEYQQETLRWATTVAAVWRITEGPVWGERLIAPQDAGGQIGKRGPLVSDRAVLEILAGSGLLRRSGTVTPDPLPVQYVAGEPVEP
jgi:hypothetical protein